MWRFLGLGLVMIVVVVTGFSLINTGTTEDISASALLSSDAVDTSGFAHAIGPWDWQFPADFGPHPAFQTEWWYYTGNLADANGRRFGFQFTIFRRALSPTPVASDSEWRTNQVYMAHFTLSDIGGEAFHHEERFSRDSDGLAGATMDPTYHVWLDDWAVQALNPQASETHISATMNDGSAVDLQLTQVKPPALQGKDGLSPKSDTPGNASYYFSLTRLPTEGTVMVDGQQYSVSGLSWQDHEFSTSALGPDAQGWDWFGLIFDDGREMTIGRIRLVDGAARGYSGSDSLAMLVEADGSTRQIPADHFKIEALDHWTSPHSGADYPSGWRVTVTEPDDSWSFTVTPLLRDQELYGGGITYWEGAVRLDGDVSGYGYTELTGYVDALTGRF